MVCTGYGNGSRIVGVDLLEEFTGIFYFNFESIVQDIDAVYALTVGLK